MPKIKMKLKTNLVLKSILTLTKLILSFSLIISEPANAFIPYIYEPNTKNLQVTGISVGRTAARLIQFGQTKEATRLAELAVRLNPNDERLWLILAETQIQRNQLKNASKSLAKAKQIKPEKASLWFAEGSLALRQEKTKKAIFLIRQGLRLEPNN